MLFEATKFTAAMGQLTQDPYEGSQARESSHPVAGTKEDRKLSRFCGHMEGPLG